MPKKQWSILFERLTTYEAIVEADTELEANIAFFGHRRINGGAVRVGDEQIVSITAITEGDK